jgi:hypothetical protein
MLFDKYISNEMKIYIAILSGALWIYFRTSDCYNMIPRLHILPVIFVSLWIYLNYKDPLFLPLGLLLLILYMYIEPLITSSIL